MIAPNNDALPRVCVVVPTYNNCGTLGEVIRQVRRFVPDTIVVNDGSTDDTADVLGRLGDIVVLTHERNRGKGEALANGFHRAIAAGFTHAITLDADGQHVADDLPKFLQAVRSHPEALIVGSRDLTGKGRRLKSRLLRAHSNFWVWLATGQWVPDTQSGYRAYPLHKIAGLKRKCRKYDFEVEILVRAIWTGVPVVRAPVRVEYGPGSTSHFRPLRDFALVFQLNCCLLTQRLLLPAAVRSAAQLKTSRAGAVLRDAWGAMWREIVRGCDTPGRFAAAIGLGVLCGILPIWGFQIATALIVAQRLRLNKPLTVAASNVSFPAMIPFILYASLMTGRLVLMRDTDGLAGQAALTPTTAWAYATEYLVGSILLATLAGFAAFLISLVLARVVGRLLGKRQQCH